MYPHGRYCLLELSNKPPVLFMSTHIVSFIHYYLFRCEGGFPGAAWDYYVRHGLVTGGQYNTKEVCILGK